MKCKYCKNRYGKNKMWTSILGLGEINFIEVSRCIRWNVKFYRMKCKDCDNWGDPYIFETQL